ncbi:O-methyltransferase family 3 [Penicillium coprophilum]|uniref:O-methyltransferase family 3 n=1 Tax=Penicillium coprophilum TaxID=36646 RepID=UPI002399C4D3|nr:O-methyltransferase family 3 [Penicillium coprophilum]KAJ5163157.1 O-methyltransferase family 3 [Penicillium coprophilum]
MKEDQRAVYKPQEANNDGREERLLEFIQSHPKYKEMQGKPEIILAAIDEFGHKEDFLMNVGWEKGNIVAEKLIPELQPDFMIELGGYVGYSALLFGSALKRARGRKYLSLEASPKYAAIAAALVELAGLNDVVEIIIGPCRDSLRKLRQTYPTGAVDVLFIDHAKPHYVNDLKLCEELSLVRPGTTVIADNVILPGNPEYRAYVRESTDDKIHRVKQEQKAQMASLAEPNDELSLGNPYLTYDTTLIESLAPTGEVVSFPSERLQRHCLI